MEREVYSLALVLACISIASGLECYTCSNQDSNKDKCATTTMQCEESQDACMTYIRWGIPPYWTPHGDRIHHISKGCDTRTACDLRRAATMTYCKRDWYDDWACYECCTGDLCNYYVTLGAGVAKSSLVGIVLAAAASLFLWWRR